ncbi:hypothetical protein NA57DRAFT_70559 [Rhizodiscina lignyota]|uniref:Uncharacterized protein n=1 Tax=Rhizodiscina lignyota TaxID=1504668 RepID=A0A9P4MGB3_9PEZI|nr:hypothetical protein NA57DRAFT_70559 [Rhizodiscina lignyota]
MFGGNFVPNGTQNDGNGNFGFTQEWLPTQVLPYGFPGWAPYNPQMSNDSEQSEQFGLVEQVQDHEDDGEAINGGSNGNSKAPTIIPGLSTSSPSLTSTYSQAVPSVPSNTLPTSSTPQPDNTERAARLRAKLMAMRPNSAEPGPRRGEELPKTTMADVESLIAEERAVADKVQQSSPPSSANAITTVQHQLAQAATSMSTNGTHAAVETPREQIQSTESQQNATLTLTPEQNPSPSANIGVRPHSPGDKASEDKARNDQDNTAQPKWYDHANNTEVHHTERSTTPLGTQNALAIVRGRKNENEAAPDTINDQYSTVNRDIHLEESELPLRSSAARHSHHFDDLDEWLEITGYHDRQYRERYIRRHRALAELEARRAEIEAEFDAEGGPHATVHTLPATISMPPPPRPVSVSRTTLLPSPISLSHSNSNAQDASNGNKRYLSQDDLSSHFEPPDKIQRIDTSKSTATNLSTPSSKTVVSRDLPR